MAKISTRWYNGVVNGIQVRHDYPCHSSNYTNYFSRNASYVIMHYSGNKKDYSVSNCKYFQGANRKASAHFFLDDTNIQQSVELCDSAWSIGCSKGYKTSARNANTINIEMCCTAGNYRISQKTQINGAYLCAEMCKLLGITSNMVDTYVLRHYDCVKTNKACPKQYVQNPNEWVQFKTWVKNILNTGSHVGHISLVKDGVDYSHVLDTKYYADCNADLKNAFGYDEVKLFNHFLTNGMTDRDKYGNLSRAGKTIPTFNIDVYMSHSADLRQVFGNDIKAYYKHYCQYGYKENRRAI